MSKKAPMQVEQNPKAPEASVEELAALAATKAAADAAAAKEADAAAAAKEADAAKDESPKAKGERVWARAAKGDMLHLHTNVWITQDPKRMLNDDFLKAQVAAGKVILGDD